MKVAFVIPGQKHIYEKMHPPSQIHMGIAYLASAIEDISEVTIIDMDAEGLDIKGYGDRISEKEFDLIGVTVTTPTFYGSCKIARITREISPETVIMFGGSHPTLMPYETIASPDVDIVVCGEGEESVREIVIALEKESTLDNINGILFRRESDGLIVDNGKRPIRVPNGLDRLKFPARHLFPNQRYTYPDALYGFVAPLITSRGCPGRCTYCNTHTLHGGKVQFRSSKNVVDEIAMLAEGGVQEIHIWDDNFATKRSRVFEISDEIQKRGIQIPIAFPAGIRADYLDREVLMALKNMGTYSLAVGVESGDQGILDLCKKRVTLQKIEEVFNLAHGCGLETWAFFMFGLPGETPDTIRKTIAFAHLLKPDVAKFHILKPYPGSEVYDWLNERGLILSHDYDAFGIHGPPVHRLDALSPDDMVEWQKRAYRSFYFNPHMIIKQILRIRTLNRLRLNINAGIDLIKMNIS